MADLADTIQDVGSKPQSVTTDGLSVSNRPIGDVIAADRYAKAAAAAKVPYRGLRFTRFTPPAQCGANPVETNLDGAGG